MVDGFVNIEEKDLGFLVLLKEILSQIDQASAVDEHEHFDFLEWFWLFNAALELSVGGDRVDLILNVLALEHFLSRYKNTENILRVQMESTSTAIKMTIETDSMLSSYSDNSWNIRAMSLRSIFIFGAWYYLINYY